MLGLVTSGGCIKVTRGFWAPMASKEPEPCPASGFFCPGWEDDGVNDPPGSKPIIVSQGGATVEQKVEVVQQELTLDMAPKQQASFGALSVDAFASGATALLPSLGQWADDIAAAVALAKTADGAWSDEEQKAARASHKAACKSKAASIQSQLQNKQRLSLSGRLSIVHG